MYDHPPFDDPDIEIPVAIALGVLMFFFILVLFW